MREEKEEQEFEEEEEEEEGRKEKKGESEWRSGCVWWRQICATSVFVFVFWCPQTTQVNPNK